VVGGRLQYVNGAVRGIDGLLKAFAVSDTAS